jgi:RNA polymerase sigma factor (sigma-70 family)
MGNSQLQSVVEHIRNLAAPELTNDRTDQELLRDFSSRRDQAAFTILVKRHASMVLGICHRVLNHAQDAEDAFQATFLLLARKPTAIRKQTALASWLHSVAYRTAMRAKRDSARRRFHEKRVAPMARTPATSELALRELQALLDQEIERLAEKYKAPFVLCCLEGKSKTEAANELGWKVGTVSSRLAYARKFLQTRLSRRGVSLSAALGAVALTPDGASAAVPGLLIDGTVKAALEYATGKGALDGLISAEVASLVKGVAKSMAISKFKSALVLMLGMSIAATGIGTFTHHLLAESKGGETTEAQPPSADKPTPQPHAEPAAATGTVRVVVLDPNGKPLPGARVQAQIWTEEKPFHTDRDYETDATGVAQVQLPKSFTTLRLYARKKPFATLLAGWEKKELASGAKVPAEYLFRMEPAVSAGGRIVDEHGKPIASARVRVMMNLANHLKPANSDGRVHYDNWLAAGANEAKTDAEGRWRIDNVPNHPQTELHVNVSHREYLSDEDWQRIQQAAGITTATLRQGTATVTMKRGIIVAGRVTDLDSKPVRDALVFHGEGPYLDDPTNPTSTGADGRFRLPALARGQTTMAVLAPGWAPQVRRLDLQPGLAPQEFRLKPGKAIRLRIVDVAAKPIPHADVVVVGLGGSKLLLNFFQPPRTPDTQVPRYAGPDGVWEWTWAPEESVKLQVGLKRFGDNELEIAGGAPERTVVLKTEHRITGRVTDAVTGKPIPRFTVIPVDVFRKDFLCAERNNSVPGKDGRLQYLAQRTDIALRLRVEAPGYRTQDGPEFRVGDATSRTQDFRLKPSRPITGVVLGTSGQAASKVTVLLAVPTETVRLGYGQNHQTTTDAAGRFEFPDPGESIAVLARADSGFAFAEFPADHLDVGTLRLRPWASVRGQFRDGGRPVPGATIILNPIRIDTLDRPSIYGWTQTVTGPDGRFEFPRAAPGPVSVHVSLGPWKDEGFRCGPSMPLDLQPGERVELDLGGTGAGVSGKVMLTGKVPADLDCTYSLNYLVRRSPGIAPPSEVAKLGFDAKTGWRDAWRKTREGLTFMNTLQHWFVKLAPDGAFRVSGVPPGEYDLALEVYAKPSGCLVDPLARKVVRVTVTAEDVARGELALPDIAMAIAPVPGIGDTPELGFQSADGSTGTLAKYRGHYTIVHFWASWCVPCMQQLPALRRLHERFSGRGVTTLGLSLDEDATAWQAALKRLDPPWIEGRLAAVSQLGISSVPTYWLLDPAGKIVAKVYDPDELTSVLTDRLK